MDKSLMDKYVIAKNGIAFSIKLHGMTLSETKAELKRLRTKRIDDKFYSCTPIINGVYFAQFHEENGIVRFVANRYEVMTYKDAIFE